MKRAGHTLYGTLNLLILRTLADSSEGRAHGLGILKSITEAARDALIIEEGALYPALHRLERDGMLLGEWGTTDEGRRAKFYRLTPKGQSRLDQESAHWLRHVQAVARVLGVVLPEVGGDETVAVIP